MAPLTAEILGINEDLGVLHPAWPELLIGDPSLQFSTQVEEYPEENAPENVPLVWPVELVSAEPRLNPLTAEEFMHYIPPIEADGTVSFGVEERSEPLEIDWDL